MSPNNTFGPTAISVAASHFVSTDASHLFVARDANGNLPEMDFLVARQGTAIAQSSMGWAWQTNDATAIHNTTGKTPASGKIFDLNGRRVTKTIPGRIYIIDGRLSRMK